MHQVSLETICPLKAFQLHYCPDNDAKSIVKHFIFLHEFSVVKASDGTGCLKCTTRRTREMRRNRNRNRYLVASGSQGAEGGGLTTCDPSFYVTLLPGSTSGLLELLDQACLIPIPACLPLYKSK